MTSSTLSVTPAVARKPRPFLTRRPTASIAYWVALAILLAGVIFTAHPQYPESAVGAALIIVAAWFPALLWIRRGMAELPIFPVFALTYTWTFGLPLLYEHPIVSHFEAVDQIYAAFCVAGFLTLATAVWNWIKLLPMRSPRSCLLISEGSADAFFFAILMAALLFTIAINGAWLAVPVGVYSIIRAVMLAVEALSCFVLSYRLGRGELFGTKALVFKGILLILILISLVPLMMINSMAVVALSALGYVAASKKVPWISFAVAIAAFAFLHLGKSEMRDRYWGDADQGPVQPSAYPSFFSNWISASLDQFDAETKHEEDETTSLLERASLMQLLLYEQTLSSSVPFLYGDTYVIIPELLIPRIVFSDKPTSHEGTYRLNIHYGFQTREDTETTTIGFGLLNEAYANFGLAGMAMLALVIGAFYGLVERWAVVVPLLSLRGLFAIMVASYSFQTEFAAGVYVAALFQSVVALLGLSIFIIRQRPNPLAIAVSSTAG